MFFIRVNYSISRNQCVQQKTYEIEVNLTVFIFLPYLTEEYIIRYLFVILSSLRTNVNYMDKVWKGKHFPKKNEK